jgi:hypothetical protein
VDEEFEVDVSRLQAALTALPAEQIVSFEEVLQRFFNASYSLSLWGAARGDSATVDRAIPWR